MIAADTAFFLLEKQSNEAERRAAIQAVYHEDSFKRPDMPLGVTTYYRILDLNVKQVLPVYFNEILCYHNCLLTYQFN